MSGKIGVGWRDRVDLYGINLHEVPRSKIDRPPARILLSLYPLKKSHMIRKLEGEEVLQCHNPLTNFITQSPMTEEEAHHQVKGPCNITARIHTILWFFYKRIRQQKNWGEGGMQAF